MPRWRMHANKSHPASEQQRVMVNYAQSTFGMRAQSTFGPFFPSPCMQTPVSIPSFGVEWTCGLQLDGTFNCTGASLFSRVLQSRPRDSPQQSTLC